MGKGRGAYGFFPSRSRAILRRLSNGVGGLTQATHNLAYVRVGVTSLMQNIVRLSLLVAFSAQAGAADISATSKVDAVTVFLSGAEVMRLAKVKLDKGDHTIAIVDIPASAVPGSIRVEGNATGKLDISSVDTRRTFLARQDAQAADQERRSLEDQIEALRDQKASADAQVAAAETQRMLISNLAQLPTRPAPAAAGAAGEDWQRVLSLIAQGDRKSVV